MDLSDLYSPHRELTLQTVLPSQRDTSSTSVHVEYTIYAYDHFQDEDLGQNRWQRVTTSYNPAEALLKAEQLFLTQQYQKIEIKKKAFNNKKGQHVASTFRVFENRSKNNYLTLATILLLAVSSVGLFYLKYF